MKPLTKEELKRLSDEILKRQEFIHTLDGIKYRTDLIDVDDLVDALASVFAMARDSIKLWEENQKLRDFLEGLAESHDYNCDYDLLPCTCHVRHIQQALSQKEPSE